MNKEHVASHFDSYLGMILKRIPESDRKTLKVVVQDSYETGGQNFTDGFIRILENIMDTIRTIPTCATRSHHWQSGSF